MLVYHGKFSKEIHWTATSNLPCLPAKSRRQVTQKENPWAEACVSSFFCSSPWMLTDPPPGPLLTIPPNPSPAGAGIPRCLIGMYRVIRCYKILSLNMLILQKWSVRLKRYTAKLVWWAGPPPLIGIIPLLATSGVQGWTALGGGGALNPEKNPGHRLLAGRSCRQ